MTKRSQTHSPSSSDPEVDEVEEVDDCDKECDTGEGSKEQVPQLTEEGP